VFADKDGGRMHFHLPRMRLSKSEIIDVLIGIWTYFGHNLLKIKTTQHYL
jgi:hypothetical protein